MNAQTEASMNVWEGGAYLEQLRLEELEQAAARMPADAAVLEIGAGSGWQARELSKMGFSVSAIDVPDSNYRATRIWPVTEYDGVSIPFSDAAFDVVFSSNVLEHIRHIESFQVEMQRVLKPGGIAVHLVPSATWRLWTSLAHYPFLVKHLGSRLFGSAKMQSLAGEAGARTRQRGMLALTWRVLLSPRHGEFGGPLSELYYFSRFRWDDLFARTGWIMREHAFNRLFYTGYGLMALRLPFAARARLSRLLGSSCHLYVLQKAGQ